MSTDIGLARKQKVFAVKETVEGTLEFPSDADLIRPAGTAVMNQSPDYSDSEEVQDSLDVLDQFANAMPAGEFSLPTYVRPSGTVGSVPQGGVLFESMQGGVESAAVASLSSEIGASTATIVFDTRATGEFPERGIVQVGTEDIYYTSITRGSRSATTGTLTGLTRGYNSTSAATHATNDSITAQGVFYKQATSSPSFSLWIETDHFTQGMSGCSITSATLSVSNEGGVTFNFSGQGMQMVWAGKDALSTNAASGATQIYVADADRFSAGAYIQNYTKSDNNSSSGYKISSVTSASNLITLETSDAISEAWATDDVIQGYLPTGTAIGSPIEGRHTSVELNSVSAKFKNSELSFNVPKQYLVDEVGTTYPEAYIEDKRSITANLNLYFRQADAKYFAEGYSGNEIPIALTFGDTIGSKMLVYMKKCRLPMPDISSAPPAIELSMPMTALGTDGEDSCEIIFE
jgi:hypothetical protein